MVVGILETRLAHDFEVDVVKVTPKFDYRVLQDYDYYIFASPIYGGHLPVSMQEFLNRLPEREGLGKAMVLLTYSYAKCDVLDTMAQCLNDRHYSIMSRWSVKCPSTYLRAMYDLPIQWLNSYEKNLKEKLDDLIQSVFNDMYSRRTCDEMNDKKSVYLNKINDITKHIGMKAVAKTRNNLTILPERCAHCFYCVENCNTGCFAGTGDVPDLNAEYCDGCLKCVHNCPQNAIVINGKHRDFERLDRTYYDGIKSELI